MKKKCTNSACRRAFTPRQEGGAVRCPHCGKTYPRMTAAETAHPQLVICGWIGSRKIEAIQKLRRQFGLGLRELKELLERLDQQPLVLSDLEPDAIAREQTDWEASGFITRVESAGAVSGAAPGRQRKYRLILTGCAPESRAQAAKLLYTHVRLPLPKAVKASHTLRRQGIVAATGLDLAFAQELAAAAWARGVSAKVVRDHPPAVPGSPAR